MADNKSYTIVPELELIITYCQGHVSLDDLIILNRQFMSDKLFDPSFNVLMDFRDSIALAFSADIQDYIGFLKGELILPKRVRVGILYSTPNYKFLISIYKPLAKLLSIDVNSFKEINECFEWMQFRPEDQSLIQDVLKSHRQNLSN